MVPEADEFKTMTKKFANGNILTRTLDESGKVVFKWSKAKDKADEAKEYSVRPISVSDTPPTTSPSGLEVSGTSRTEEVVAKDDPKEVDQKEPLAKDDANNKKHDSAPPIYFILLFIASLVLVGFLIGLSSKPLGPNPMQSKILSEKIIVAKQLIKMKGAYDHQIMRQVDAVLDYDFIEHGVIKDFREEEMLKAIFKHSYNDPISMDLLMKLSCTDDHARIYIAAKCSKLNQPEEIIEKCKTLYEKCQMV